MGIFNFRTFAVVALFCAVLAIAAPAIEKRDITISLAPIIGALTSLSSSLSAALSAVDDVQKAVVKDASVSSCRNYSIDNAQWLIFCLRNSLLPLLA
jgi:hypothetical protein